MYHFKMSWPNLSWTMTSGQNVLSDSQIDNIKFVETIWEKTSNED